MKGPAVITQLDPPLPVRTPRGKGIAHLVIDYGPEHDLFWKVFLDANGECWTFANPDIRADTNLTLGRVVPKPNGAADHGDHHGADPEFRSVAAQ